MTIHVLLNGMMLKAYAVLLSTVLTSLHAFSQKLKTSVKWSMLEAFQNTIALEK
jgi:hypothetical protein